jgi:hypothetical protein
MLNVLFERIRVASFVQRFGLQRCTGRGGLKREDGQGTRCRTHTFLDVWRHGREERMIRPCPSTGFFVVLITYTVVTSTIVPVEMNARFSTDRKKILRPSTSINDEGYDPSRDPKPGPSPL